MNNLFGFLLDMGNYEDRKVDRFDVSDNFFISTAEVTDSDDPYETAIKHPAYNDGIIIIVETYKTKEEAQEGHNKWVKIMTDMVLPEFLMDVSTCGSAKFRDEFDEDDWRIFYKDEEIN